VDALFLEMQETRTMMAFVVNEFGASRALSPWKILSKRCVGEIHTATIPTIS
jgi:CBS domain containing-hemolysin-like protein